MNSKAITVLAISLFLILQSQVSAQVAQVTCNIKAGCEGDEVAILELTPASGSGYHAAVLGSGYPERLCCAGYDIEPGSGRNEQTGLKLSSPTNAHVCWGCTDPDYNNNVVGFSFGDTSISDVTCSYKSSCDAGESCILSFLGGNTNAHVVGCGSGDGSLCCSFSADTQGPTASDDYQHPNQWVVGAQNFQITADDDDGSGVKLIYMKYLRHFFGASTCSEADYDEFITPCGTGDTPCTVNILDTQNVNDYICYYAEDNAGNKGPVGSVRVMVDNAPPRTLCTNCPDDGSVIGSPFTVTLTASDDSNAPANRNSGVAGTYLCVSTSATCIPSRYTGPVTISTEGIYHIRYYSIDNVGHSEDMNHRTVTYDTSLPVCEFSSSLPATLNTRNVHLEWTASDSVSSTFDHYDIYARKSLDDGNSYTEDAGSHTITTESQTSYDFQLQSDGKFRFYCEVTYLRGGTPKESGADTYDILVDTENPAITLLGPNPEYSDQETFTISWNIDDISNIDHYDLTINGNQVGGDIPAAQTSTTYTGTNGQSYAVSVIAYDLSGNPSDPAEKTVHVDTQPPACSMAPLPGYVNSTSFGVSWSSPDTDAVSYDLCISTDGSACTAPTPGYTGITETTRTLTGSNRNTYHIACRATDSAGNTGDWSSTVNTTIDTTPPSLDSSQYTAALTSTDYEDLLVNITVSDEAGIGDVSLVLGGSEVAPTYKSGSSGDTEWSLVWEIPYDTYMAFSVFTITMDDVSGNSESQDFSYSVSDCNAGETRACNPVDPSGNAYNQGVCRGTGNRTCQADGTWSNCTGGTLPTQEDCNGLDDDCDGEVDEDLDNHPCGPSSDLGICVFGTSSCLGGAWTTCIGAVYPMAKENCGNGLDDDCDGVVNNDCDCLNNGETKPCGESNVGICRLGTSTCSGGLWGECIGAVYSITEQCDNTLDDDCDGLTDCEDSDCLGSYHCEGTAPTPDGEPFPWWWLSVIGVAMLVVLVIVWYYFRSQGEELTWEAVKDKWTSSD